MYFLIIWKFHFILYHIATAFAASLCMKMKKKIVFAFHKKEKNL